MNEQNSYEERIKTLTKNYETSLKAVYAEMEKEIVNRLKNHGNYLILPTDENILVPVIDGFGRDVEYVIYAVGNTKDDHLIYITSEAITSDIDKMGLSLFDLKDGEFDKIAKKSKYWWFMNENLETSKAFVEIYRIINKLNIV